jgi:hypothetical protein
MSKTVKILLGALAAIAVIALCAIVAVVLLNQTGEPEPTAVAPTVTPAAEDDSWERIKAAGKIVVGTSADYPPFESYVAQGQIDGFDVALMDEIGRRLGVQVEYQDHAFDGLGTALQLKQIDAAIAAISITPQRESEVDFSNVYLVGVDGILAQQDASLSISSVDDLAKVRLGVQRGSVYEDWLYSELVATGKMPEAGGVGSAASRGSRRRRGRQDGGAGPEPAAIRRGLSQGCPGAQGRDRPRADRPAQRGHHRPTGQAVPGPGPAPAHAHAGGDEHAGPCS